MDVELKRIAEALERIAAVLERAPTEAQRVREGLLTAVMTASGQNPTMCHLEELLQEYLNHVGSEIAGTAIGARKEED